MKKEGEESEAQIYRPVRDATRNVLARVLKERQWPGSYFDNQVMHVMWSQMVYIHLGWIEVLDLLHLYYLAMS